MKKILAVFFLVIVLLSVFSGCKKNIERPEITTGCGGEPTPIYGEDNYEDMIYTINTVDADTFEKGMYKSLIECVRKDNYIIRPLYDGAPLLLRERDGGDRIYMEPYIREIPHRFMYLLDHDGVMYRFLIFYIDENYLDKADKYGYQGYEHFLNGGNYWEWITKDHKDQEYRKINFAGKKRNVTFINDDEVMSYFVWEKYLIRVDCTLDNGGIDHCVEFIKHLSFEKVKLK